MLPITPILVVLATTALIYRVCQIGRRPKNYPPGPPTLPILGNILQFEKWARQYGPIYSLMLGTQCMIVLSDDAAGKELLDRRSAIYSSRQDMYIGQELCSGSLRLLMMKYGPTWRMFRKMVYSLLNVVTFKSYIPYQMLENKQMLYQILTEPEDFLKHIRRYSDALTTTMVFGWRTPTYDDPKMKQLFAGFAEFADLNQTGPAAFIDFFPLLQKLPASLLPAKKKAMELHVHEKALYKGHWLKAKEDIRNGTIKPCFSIGMYETQKKEGFSDDQACYISGTLLEAGSDTTSSTFRLPSWKTSTIYSTSGAAWTPRHSNPREYNPGRCKDDRQSLGDAAANPDGSKRDAYTFGAGRRICPGIHVAERSLFLGMARILWAFEIRPAKDEVTGEDIIPDQERLTQGFVCMPVEFPADIRPRSKERADMVRREWEDAKRECLDLRTGQWLQSPVDARGALRGMA
ncbi:cytochrome P450 [Aspergillus venezuelensis]